MAKLLATLSIVVGVVAVAAVVLMGSDDDEGSSMTAVPAEAHGAYFAGPNFGDLPLTEVVVPPRGAGDSTSFTQRPSLLVRAIGGLRSDDGGTSASRVRLLSARFTFIREPPREAIASGTGV